MVGFPRDSYSTVRYDTGWGDGLKEGVEGMQTGKMGGLGRVRLGFLKIRQPDFEF